MTKEDFLQILPEKGIFEFCRGLDTIASRENWIINIGLGLALNGGRVSGLYDYYIRHCDKETMAELLAGIVAHCDNPTHVPYYINELEGLHEKAQAFYQTNRCQ